LLFDLIFATISHGAVEGILHQKIKETEANQSKLIKNEIKIKSKKINERS
jgi:hypothetical protein